MLAVATINDIIDGNEWGLLVHTDTRNGMAKLPKGCVNTVTTSPPYYLLRDNNAKKVTTIWGGRAECVHDWRDGVRPGITGGTASPKVQIKGSDNFQIVEPQAFSICLKCDAWRGQLGQELTVEDYCAHLLECFREVKRVLHPTGSLWLNIGTSYSGSGKGPTGHNGFQNAESRQGFTGTGPRAVPGYKQKDDMMIPFEVFRALQRDGWWVRTVSPWIKPNAMSHPALDRQNVAIEWIAHLTCSQRYYYESNRVRRPGVSEKTRNWRTSDPWSDSLEDLILEQESMLGYLKSIRDESDAGTLADLDGRILSFKTLTSKYQGKHFSTFPDVLIEPMIEATTPLAVCLQCLMPYVGQRRTCVHTKAGSMPGLVFDPFCGVGTAVRVAVEHGRRGLGFDMNDEYVALGNADLRLVVETANR